MRESEREYRTKNKVNAKWNTRTNLKVEQKQKRDAKGNVKQKIAKTDCNKEHP